MVTKKPKGLGRGLEALLGPKVEEKVEQAQAVQAGLPSALPLTELVHAGHAHGRRRAV